MVIKLKSQLDEGYCLKIVLLNFTKQNVEFQLIKI